MKNHLYRRLFYVSLAFYLISTAYIRILEGYRLYSVGTTLLASLPLDVFPLKDIFEGPPIDIQMSVVSAQEVAQMLQTDILPRAHEGLVLPTSDITTQNCDYLVVRFKTPARYASFNWKCYLSCFPYAIALFQHINDTGGFYENIILPYPSFLESPTGHPCDITLREKCVF